MSAAATNDAAAAMETPKEKAKWNGVKLAKEAENDETNGTNEAKVEADGAASVFNETRVEDPAAPVSGSAEEEQERILEQLLQLRLADPSAAASSAASGASGSIPSGAPLSTSSSSSSLGSSSAAAAAAAVAAVLPPPTKPPSRIQLYQPRTKIEQFEDIIMESKNMLNGVGGDVGANQLSLARDMDDELEELRMLRQLAIAAASATSSNPASVPSPGSGKRRASPAKSAADGSADPGRLDLGRPELDAIYAPASEEVYGAAAGPLCTLRPDSDDPAADSAPEQPCSCLKCSKGCLRYPDEVEILRQCWQDLSSDVCCVFRLALDSAWNDSNRDRPDLHGATRDRVRKLCTRADPHRLYLRLEAIIRKFALEVKAGLFDLVHRQEKDPNLAQDFVRVILESYEKMCSAAQHLSPSMADLERHLRQFSLTWEVVNKHVYQESVYKDALVQNNLPIFVSQLRSLFPDKDHEVKYTKLVRGYLDFDVDMENVRDLWRTAEPLLTTHAKDAARMRDKQQALRAEWERFKAAQASAAAKLEKGIEVSDESLLSDHFVMSTEIGESLNHIIGIEELGGLDEFPSEMEQELRRVMRLSLTPTGMFSDCEDDDEDGADADDENDGTDEFHLLFDADDEGDLLHGVSLLNLLPPDAASPQSSEAAMVAGSPLAFAGGAFNFFPLEMAYENMDHCMAEEPGTDCNCHACLTKKQNPHDTLATLQKSLIGNDTGGATSQADLAALFPSVLSADRAKSKAESAVAAFAEEAIAAPPKSTPIVAQPSKSENSSSHQQSVAASSSSSSSGSQQQHQPGAATNEKRAKAGSSRQQVANNRGSTNGSGGCKGFHHGGTSAHAKELNRLLHQHYCKNHASNSKQHQSQDSDNYTPEISDEEDEDDEYDCTTTEGATEDDSCSSSASHGKDANGDPSKCLCCYCEVFGHGTPSMAPVSRNYPKMRERLRLLLSKKKKAKKGTGEAQHTPPPPPPPPAQQPASSAEGSRPVTQPAAKSTPDQSKNQQQLRPSPAPGSASAPTPPVSNNKPPANQPASRTVAASTSTVSQDHTPTATAAAPLAGSTDELGSSHDVDELLNFIEGKDKTVNEKKRAKKERQKAQRLEEMRRREEEERKRREAEEAERKRREEAERKAREAEHQAMKKAKKKAAQKAKKAAAKGLPPPIVPDEETGESKPEPEVDPAAQTLEELKMKQMLELQQLQLLHQKQIHEEQLRLHQSQNPPGKKQPKGANAALAAPSLPLSSMSYVPPPGGLPSAQSAPVPPPSASSPSSSSQPQIKISRTPSGRVEFTQIPAGGGKPTAAPTPFYPTAPGVSAPMPGGGGGAPSGTPFPGYTLPPQPSQHHLNSGGLTYLTNGQSQQPAAPSAASSSAPPSRPSPHVPSASGQPMVTIRRVQHPASDEPTVTISMKDKKQEDRLLYTLVNGHVKRAPGAPNDVELIPGAEEATNGEKKKKAMSKKQRKKMKQQQDQQQEEPEVKMEQPPALQNYHQQQQHASAAMPQPASLPVNDRGRLDVDGLSLPPGISITKIEGQAPERKYFPSKADQPNPAAAAASLHHRQQQQMPVYAPPQPQQMMTNSGFVPGFPMMAPHPAAPAASSNVIVVDTNSLKTKAEEEGEAVAAALDADALGKRAGNKKTKGKKILNSATAPPGCSNKALPHNPLAATTMDYASAQQLLGPNFLSTPSQLASSMMRPTVAAAAPTHPPPPQPSLPAAARQPAGSPENDLKKGPQVLIKNVNGKVVITPLGNSNSSSGNNRDAAASAVSTSAAGDENVAPPPPPPPTDQQQNWKNDSERKKMPSSTSSASMGENIDEINSIFAPKADMDLDNGEIDDEERELEAFKRFCFNSVPLQQKAKVNFDVNTLKRK